MNLRDLNIGKLRLFLVLSFVYCFTYKPYYEAFFVVEGKSPYEIRGFLWRAIE